MLSFVAVGRTDGVCGGHLSDSFSSLSAAFTLTVHINALYNERVGLHGKEEHATSINTIPLKNIAFIRVFCVEPMQSMQVARMLLFITHQHTSYYFIITIYYSSSVYLLFYFIFSSPTYFTFDG